MESAGGWSAVCSQVFTPGHQTEATLCPAFRVLIDRNGSELEESSVSKVNSMSINITLFTFLIIGRCEYES